MIEPLRGVKVVDLSTLLPGPLYTLLPAEAEAEAGAGKGAAKVHHLRSIAMSSSRRGLYWEDFEIGKVFQTPAREFPVF